MNTVLTALVAVLTLIVVALFVVVVRQGRKVTTDGSAPLTALDITQAVKDQVDVAMTALNDQARKDREEAIRLATEKAVETGAAEFGRNSQAITTTLDNYRKSLDDQITKLQGELTTLRENNSQQFGNVDSAVGKLALEAQALNRVLSSAQGRGSWGERMLEDILAESGFKRGLNYERQEVLGGGGRPDYSFYLPPNRVLYLDSKFPLDNYLKYHEAVDDVTRGIHRDGFIKNVEQRVKELEKRDYASQSERQALDYVLLFIPNESILGFIQQESPSLVDDAIRRRVVLCSPLTLYAFLAVVRQATDSFHMEQNANEVLGILNAFGKSWRHYSNHIDTIGRAFEKIGKEFEKIGKGSRTYKALAKNIVQVEELVREKNIQSDTVSLEEFEEAFREIESGDDSI
ncbi:MAG: DNA recombination protein RmuC [Acidobacteria bacterium]|nr:DNA recombination protein RmuC [Acidobacteriota bacterium]